MRAEVRRLDPSELDAARALAVGPSQQHLVAPVAVSLAEAGRYPGSEPLGVFVDGDLVGFLMGQLIEHGSEAGTYLLWDFLIDHRHQRHGHGRSGVNGAIAHARSRGAAVVSISHEPDNLIARDLYRSAGFIESGSVNADGEVEMRLDQAACDRGEMP